MPVRSEDVSVDCNLSDDEELSCWTLQDNVLPENSELDESKDLSVVSFAVSELRKNVSLLKRVELAGALLILSSSYSSAGLPSAVTLSSVRPEYDAFSDSCVP